MRLLMFALTLFVLLVPGLAWAEGNLVGASLRAWIYNSLHAAAGIVGIVAVLIMLWGVAQTAWRFVGVRIRRGQATEREALRSQLGHFILLGLEMLIVADVIETVTAPDVQHVLVLGLIVVIRTVIAFSLNWELAQEAKRGRRDDT